MAWQMINVTPGQHAAASMHLHPAISQFLVTRDRCCSVQAQAAQLGSPSFTVHRSQDAVRVSSPGPVTVDISISSPSKPAHTNGTRRMPMSTSQGHEQEDQEQAAPATPTPAAVGQAGSGSSSGPPSQETSEEDRPPLTAGYDRHPAVPMPDIRPDAEAQPRPRSSRDRPGPRTRSSRVSLASA